DTSSYLRRLGRRRRYAIQIRRRLSEMRQLDTSETVRAKCSTGTSFDSSTVAMLINVLRDAWSRLPPGQTSISRPMLAKRILTAAKTGVRDPAKLRARALADCLEAKLQG